MLRRFSCRLLRGGRAARKAAPAVLGGATGGVAEAGRVAAAWGGGARRKCTFDAHALVHAPKVRVFRHAPCAAHGNERGVNAALVVVDDALVLGLGVAAVVLAVHADSFSLADVLRRLR